MENIKVIDISKDRFLNSTSVLIKISPRNYIDLIKNNIDKNEFQRKRVNNSGTIYELLKSDLENGCLIPPIVLALQTNSLDESLNNEEFLNLIINNKNKLVILDGLQRTLTLLSIDKFSLFENNKINDLADLRVEILIGLKKNDLLYRMLTLNTGQTPMSTRHQIEILYSEYLNYDYNGISFYTETSSNKKPKIGHYPFREMVEGYTSYIERDFFSLDRREILNTVKNIRQKNNLNNEFEWFVSIYHEIVKQFDIQLSKNLWQIKNYRFTPFGKTVEEIFIHSQVLTGLGYALKTIEKNKNISINIERLKFDFNNIDDNSLTTGIDLLLQELDHVSRNSKKIGNGQRMFFGYLFWFFLDESNSETHFNLQESVISARNYFQANNIN
jgi:hypothetical protein